MRRILLSLLTMLLVASAAPGGAQAQQQCPGGRKRIVGGELARIENWPGQAAFRVYNKAAEQTVYFCGGAAISESWVLTAAHCVEGPFDYFGGQYGEPQVVLGAGDLTRVLPQDVYAVERVVVHEGYDRAFAAAKQANDTEARDETAERVGDDIALVRLARPWRGALARIPLSAEADTERSPSAQVRIAGFGQTELNKYTNLVPIARSDGMGEKNLVAGSTQLLEAAIETVPTTDCKSRYAQLYQKLNFNTKPTIGAGQLCAGLEQGQKRRDSCQGDSGGPLAIIDQQGCPLQIGIASWGYGCAEKDAYGVYTRVSHYAQWIQAQAGPIPDPTPFRDRIGSALSPAQLQEGLTQLEDLLGAAKGRVRIGVHSGNRVRLGEKVAFEAESAVAGRLVILDIDANREVVLIYPNQFVPPRQAGTITPGQKVEVPGTDYPGFAGFRASEPTGKGVLLAIVVPESFDIERFAAPSSAVSRGFTSVTSAPSYLMRLIRQIEVMLDTPGRGAGGGAGLEAWGYGASEYEIVR